MEGSSSRSGKADDHRREVGPHHRIRLYLQLILFLLLPFLSLPDIKLTAFQRRRIQGREAQRRFRMRKDQALQVLQASNESLQGIVEQMSTTFLQFGDKLWREGYLAASNPMANEWREALAKILALAEKAQKMGAEGEEDLEMAEEHGTSEMGDEFASSPPQQQQQQQPSGSGRRESEPGPLGTAPGARDPLYSPPLPTSFSQNDLTSRRLEYNATSPVSSSRRPQQRPTAFMVASGSGISRPAATMRPSLIRLPTLNPLMADDYDIDTATISNPSVPFATRLVRSTLLRAHRCLDLQRWGHVDQTQPSYDRWLQQYTQYSSRVMTSPITLLGNTRAALRSLVASEGDVGSNIPTDTSTPASSLAQVQGHGDQDLEYRRLQLARHFGLHAIGTEIRSLMIADGVAMEGLLDAEQVVHHLTQAGVVWTNEHVVHFYMSPSTAEVAGSMEGVAADTLMTPDMTQTSTPTAFVANAAVAATVAATSQEPIVVAIRVERLIERIMDGAVWLGDGIGFWTTAVDEALVGSAE